MLPPFQARVWFRQDQSIWRRPDAERLFGKAGYDPAQPRRPRGDPEGPGRWVDEDGPGEQPAAASSPDRPVVVIGALPGIGHNGGPPLDPPTVPVEPPGSGRTRFSIIKDAVRWLNPLRAMRGFFGAALAALSCRSLGIPVHQLLF
jgi:hypothetical protein